jgi:hypothetical protein
VEWIKLAEDLNQWLSLINTTMNHKSEEFLDQLYDYKLLKEDVPPPLS